MMKSTKRLCITCGSAGLTGSHIIGRLLSDLLPPVSEPTVFTRWAPEVGVVQSTVNIHPADHEVKRLCKSCNGWMAANLEEPVKPVLLRMIAGAGTELTVLAQHLLATWVCLAVMLRGTQDPRPWGISSEEHRWIRGRVSPPPGWGVFVACNADGAAVATRHYRVETTSGVRHISYLILGSVSFVAANDPEVLATFASSVIDQDLINSISVIHPATDALWWPPGPAVEQSTLWLLTSLGHIERRHP